MSDSNLRKQSTSEEKQKRVTLATSLGKEELIAPSSSQRNWRGILIALLVIIAVLGLIICSIFLLSPPDDGPRVRGIHFSLESVIQNQFAPRLFNGSWISDLELVYRDQYGNIKMFCVENFTTKSLMTNMTFESINAVDYKVSADLNYILLITNVVKIWKYSFEAKYYVYEVASEEYFPLRATHEDGEQEDQQYLESATWAPTGNAIVFIYKNNLYYKSRIRKPQVYTLTRNGIKDTVFNGRPDFLYETKILESATAFWFSSESTMLAFASFNCSQVGKLQYPSYGNSNLDTLKTIRYPRAGMTNPTVELIIVNMTYPKILKTSRVHPPHVYTKDNDYYLTGVKWINPREISVTWMNRRQNLTSISVCKSPSWICVDIYQDLVEDGWVNKITNPIFDNNGTWFLAILPIEDGSRGRFHEMCQVDSTSRKFIYLTTPPMIVLEILAWDLHNHLVYFTATFEPGSRHLFKTGDRNSSQRSWDCLTCFYDNRTSVHGTLKYLNKRTSDGEKHYRYYKNFLVNATLDQADRSPHCLFSKVYFSSVYNPKYYILECLGPDVPSIAIYEVFTNSMVTLLDGNTELRYMLNSMAAPQVRKFQVELESGYQAQVRLLLPPGLREHEEVNFPLILHVDSAPGSQLVTEKFQINWWWYLSGHRNFIVAEIDGRGTGLQREKLVRPTNIRIGTAQVEDQIAVVTYIKDTLKFVDKHRIGIFGMGYGGYLAALAMSQDTDLFKCGVSVNPVTNFLLTDTFSTEKYMGLPNDTDKMKNYLESNLNKRARTFREKEFLLISSTADIQVPVEHSMHFIQSLVKENVLFKHQVYPDEDHELTGVSLHYYNLIDSFWNECFTPVDFQDWEAMGSFYSSPKSNI
ncbi:hypothetical protein RUM43_014984 [Polyplax serrata]|uniref:Venom dipeptidyl peptidase 4 n=1 Tax=Polyplax serrata TaxID=468196 RepID=A0AAN8PAX0_POLSC